MTLPATMSFEFVEGIFVGVHTEAAPREDEWQHHCEHIERVRDRTGGVVVYTEGGGPTTNQRQQLRRALGELSPPPTAILTASPIVRGIITSINWFFKGERVAAFSPSDYAAALVHAGVERGAMRVSVLRSLEAQAKRIGVVLPGAIGTE